MDPQSSSPASPRGTELLAGITRQAWLANRATNALQRPAFIAAISTGAFVIAITSMVMAPRMTADSQRVVVAAPRPDTLSVLGDIALAGLHARQADSELVAARGRIAAEAARLDSLVQVDTVGRDSLTTRLAILSELRARAAQSPLLSSYRALAGAPELQSDRSVGLLLDSLAEIERERDAFGAMGGVDPVFVALTTRANDIGRRITDLADQHIAAIRRQLTDSAAMAAANTPVSIDTMSLVRTHDSIVATIASAATELERRRGVSRQLDAREEAEREREHAVASPVALLAAAVVIAGVAGFAVAFIGELRHPRVSDATEAERVLRTRILATVSPRATAAERSRRQADRAAPAHLNPTSEAYELAYLGLSNTHPAQLGVVVTGDDTPIIAVVACNLAAVAVDEARNALLIDLTASGAAASVLRVARGSGISDVARGTRDWAEVTVTADVGRNKTVDVIQRGSVQPLAAALDVLRRDAPRFGRYYDAVFVAMDESDACDAATPLPERDAVYCARRSATRLAHLEARLQLLRDKGAFVSGVVLWSALRPRLARGTAAGGHAESPRQLALSNSA